MFTLIQLMNSLGNLNHAISMVGYWIFESNYEQEMFLTRESLDLICSPSVGEEQAVKSETVFLAIRYMWAPYNTKLE